MKITSMEPKNHGIEKENHLQKLHFVYNFFLFT